MTDIAGTEVMRCLAYVRAAATRGVRLAGHDLDAFAQERPPERAGGMASVLWSGVFDRSGSLDRSMSGYLNAIGWVVSTRKGLALTDLGQAVLDEANSDSDAHLAPAVDDGFEIVIRPDEPLDYARVLDRAAQMSEVLVVDRYLSDDNFILVAKMLAVTRILTGATKTRPYRNWDARRVQLEHKLALSRSSATVRAASGSPNPLHDRLFLPRSGRGLLLGGSYGGNQVNAVVTLGEAMTRTLLRHHEAIWKAAEELTPTALAAATDAAG